MTVYDRLYYTDNGKEYKGDPKHHAFMKSSVRKTE
jgi:hypothetical protein